MTDVVVMSLERWDDVWRRNQHLIAGLLDRDPTLRVLFVRARRGSAPRPVAAAKTTMAARAASWASSALGSAGRLWLLEGAKWLPRRLAPAVDAGWLAELWPPRAGWASRLPRCG